MTYTAASHQVATETLLLLHFWRAVTIESVIEINKRLFSSGRNSINMYILIELTHTPF